MYLQPYTPPHFNFCYNMLAYIFFMLRHVMLDIGQPPTTTVRIVVTIWYPHILCVLNI